MTTLPPTRAPRIRSTRRPQAIAAIAAITAVAVVVGAAPASAAAVRGTYAVESIVLTYAASVRTGAAVLRDGTAGTLTTTLRATMTGKAGPEGAAQLRTPEVASQYVCSPACPSFVARGAVKVDRTFTPTGGGQKTTCKATRTAEARGRVYVTSAKTGTRTLVFSLQDATQANDLYQALRSTCKLPDLVPVDTYDYSSFGSLSIPTSQLGAKTIAVSLANTLKPPAYPWAATGKTSVAAKAVLARKS